MNEGDVVLIPVPQADGTIKPRPALLLRELPPFSDFLVCGISTQLRQGVSRFDEIIAQTDSDIAGSGLCSPSLVRLGFLSVVPRRAIPGVIGSISAERHETLLRNLAAHLLQNIRPDPL